MKLVRRSDSRLFLTDFGSSIYPGADTLTPSPLPPGTPAYRSPEAWLFSAQHSRNVATHYTAGPADDLYALGVTACRLVTGAYPELGEAHREEHGTWRQEPLMLPQALYSARVAPPLRTLTLRMLSVRPEQRGTAAQMAQELERAASSLADSSFRALQPPSTHALLATLARDRRRGWGAGHVGRMDDSRHAQGQFPRHTNRDRSG